MKHYMHFFYLVVLLTSTYSQIQSTPNNTKNISSDVKIQQGIVISHTKENILVDVQANIISFFNSSLQNPPSAAHLTLLLFASLFYGVLHALGPGHQKTLISGYILSEGGTYKKAIITALISTASHTLSVLILFFVILIIQQGLTASHFSNASIISSKIAGYLLAAIALFTLKRKIRVIRQNFDHNEHDKTNHTMCTCCNPKKSTQSDKTFLPIIIIGSFVPCPGAAFFLIAGYTKGSPLIGLLTVLALTLGMFMTLIGTACIALTIQRKSIEHAEKRFKKTDSIFPFFGIIGNLIILFYAFTLVR